MSTCEAHFRGLLDKLQKIIQDKWPETLNPDSGNAYEWARGTNPDLLKKVESLEKEANELWLNARDDEFKKTATEWGRQCLEVHRLYAGHLRMEQAA